VRLVPETGNPNRPELWQRPHLGHARRGPPSPATPDHHHPAALRPHGPGPAGATATSTAKTRPLPAKIDQLQRSAC